MVTVEVEWRFGGVGATSRVAKILKRMTKEDKRQGQARDPGCTASLWLTGFVRALDLRSHSCKGVTHLIHLIVAIAAICGPSYVLEESTDGVAGG